MLTHPAVHQNFETPCRKDWESAINFFATSAIAAAEAKSDSVDDHAFRQVFDKFINDVVAESKTVCIASSL